MVRMCIKFLAGVVIRVAVTVRVGVSVYVGVTLRVGTALTPKRQGSGRGRVSDKP